MTGEQLRDSGIEQAVSHADQVEPQWSEQAYQFLLSYIKNHAEFMTEDVRAASVGIVPEPPSKRAWGGVIVKAVKSGLIHRAGFKNVKNPTSHCTPASVWSVVKQPISVAVYIKRKPAKEIVTSQINLL